MCIFGVGMEEDTKVEDELHRARQCLKYVGRNASRDVIHGEGV